MKRHEEGITLIALIITIIILIILTAITISNVMGNDLFGLAKKAVVDTTIEGEREFLTTKTITSFLGSKKVGEELSDRKAFGKGSWHIVSEFETKKNYGTDWYYLESGTEVEGYGKLKYNWVVNYNTGEVEYLGESNKYANITDKSGLGVAEGLIFSADATLTDEVLQELKEGKEISQADVEERLGEGVKLHGFDNLEEAFEGGSFNFDGVDDYITVPYDKDNPDKKIEKGLTYEFYGKINGKGTSYKVDGSIYELTYKGLFCLWNGNEKQQAKLRFGCNLNSFGINELNYNLGNFENMNDFSEFSYKANPWNQVPKLSNYSKIVNFGEEVYLTVTFDGENHIQAIYIDGELLKNEEKEAKGLLNENYWNYFIKNELPTLTTFCLGRSSMESNGYWHYSNTSVYALRLYNRALTEEEVNKNYTTAVAYHNSMINQ